MAQAHATPVPGTPWSVRLFALAPVPPVVVGLGIAATMFALYVLKDYFLSPAGELRQPGGWTGLQTRMELLQAVLIGYLPTATAYSLRAGMRDLEALRPALDLGSTELEGWRRGLTCFPRALLLLVGLGAVSIGLWMPFMDGYWMYGRPPLGDPDLTWNLIRSPLLAWLIGRTVVIEVLLARRFSELGRRHARVDLLDAAPLAPFARRGLRSVLLLMLFAALFSAMLFTPFELTVTPLTLGGTVLTAVAALLLPVAGVHQRIGREKQAELARVRTVIRRERERCLADDPASGGRGAPLADLLAYEARIASVSTWPFDPSTLVRFALYVTIGVGSWLGSAFVDRLLESALG